MRELILHSGSPLDWIFSISYQWFPFISLFFGLVIGLLVSIATGGIKDKDSVEPRLLFKWSYRLFVNKARVKPSTSGISSMLDGTNVPLKQANSEGNEQKGKNCTGKVANMLKYNTVHMNIILELCE